MRKFHILFHVPIVLQPLYFKGLPLVTLQKRPVCQWLDCARFASSNTSESAR